MPPLVHPIYAPHAPMSTAPLPENIGALPARVNAGVGLEALATGKMVPVAGIEPATFGLPKPLLYQLELNRHR